METASNKGVVTIRSVSIAGYRSLFDLAFDAGPLTVITGGNGVGKTNVYRALELVHAAAHGRLARAIANEGGMSSVLWGGPSQLRSVQRKREGAPIEGLGSSGPKRARFGLELSSACYELQLGIPPFIRKMPSAFDRDPEVKEEAIWHAVPRRPSNTWLEREGPIARCLDSDGRRREHDALESGESVLSQLLEPSLLPELHHLRQLIRSFRFYHGFRTDPESPLRRAQIGTRTNILASDGSDVAAALQTILEVGDGDALRDAIRDAIGASLELTISDGNFELGVQVPGVLRRLSARELSDGTLRYLALLAALYSPRPAPLLVFNEPEASLHPKLLPSLAENLQLASMRSQIWVITHSAPLVEALGKAHLVELERDADGATRARGQHPLLGRPRWP